MAVVKIASPEGAVRPCAAFSRRVRAMASRAATAVAAVAMCLVALVLAHNLVFLAGYGSAYGDALAQTGHGDAWSAAVATVLAAGAACLLVAVWRLRRLTNLARDLAPVSADAPSTGSFVRRWLGLAWRLALVTAFLFVVQENIEHARIGETLPGLGVLGSSEYPDAIPIIALVGLAVAFVGALFGWRFATLLAHIRTARVRHRLASTTSPRVIPEVDRRPGTLRGPGVAGRAPPLATITQPAR